MGRKWTLETDPKPSANQAPTTAAASALTEEQVSRWADLIAEGQDAFPDKLPAADSNRLAAAVRKRLRNRLVRFIARAIAAEIHRKAWPDAEV
jgi:hypothetical protein